MKKVTSVLPSWEKTKTGGKAGFDKAWKTLDKLGAPVNRLSNKIGSEAFWPTSLDKESDKAARILKSFCKDGFYAEDDSPAKQEGAKGKQRVLKKIPQKVIQNAVGLAIFTTMRTGLWVSGAGGSGVLVARKEDGTWSPPSGILLHTAGLGFLVGVDIYDCVVVINNRKALDAFTKIRATLGGEISAVAGPVGVGGVLENDGKWKQANRPVFTYLKSRGFYAGVQVDGTVIIERTDENERFYGERIGVADILAGKARHPPYEIKMLMETIKAAEGSNDVDESMMMELENEPAPGDMELSSPTTVPPIFGIPEPDDPDPFGVLALEKEGLEIREAGTGSRPLSTQFEFNPSPTSPVYSKFHRRSMDTIGSRSNRESYMSTRSIRTTRSIDRSTQTETGTQTDEVITPITSPSMSGEHKRIIEEDERQQVSEPADIDYTKIDLGPYSNLNHSQEFDGTTVNESPLERDEREHSTADTSFNTEDEDEEEPVIFEAGSAAAITPHTGLAIKARGGLVNIPKRPPPPPLPPRNLARSSKILMVDQASGRSPMKSEFEEVDLHGMGGRSEESRKSRLSEESQTPIVKQAMESENIPLAEPVDEQTRQHPPEMVTSMEPTPAIEKTEEEDGVKHENEEVKVANGLLAPKTEGEDADTFHSVPTSPMEVVEVK